MNIFEKCVIHTAGISGGLEMVMRVRQAFARGFRSLLTLHGLDQRTFAEKFGVDETTVSRWASGERIPRDGTFDDICRFFNVEPAVLLGGSPEATSPPIASLPDGRVVIDLAKLADVSGFKLTPKDS